MAVILEATNSSLSVWELVHCIFKTLLSNKQVWIKGWFFKIKTRTERFTPESEVWATTYSKL